MMRAVGTTCHYLFSILLILKMGEIFCHMVRYHNYASRPRFKGARSVIKEWPVTYFFSVVFRLAPRLMKRFIFRFHVLAVALILTLFLFPQNSGFWLSAVVLFLGIWIQLLRIIVDQLKYGSSAYLSGPPISGPLVPNPLYEHHFGGREATGRLRGFLRLFLGLFLIIVLGFAALYFCAQHNLDGGALRGLSENATFWPLDCIYFSLATIATVGFGDITPLPAIIPRLLVIAEILAGFLLLVVLITSVSLTFQAQNDG
jgi:hypothetical protein